MNTPKPNEIYRHFKGNHYRIVTIATHSETKEQLVIYQALYGDYGVYARPLAMFMSEVDHDKYPEVTQKMRFELVPEVGNNFAAPASPVESAKPVQAVDITQDSVCKKVPEDKASSKPSVNIKSSDDLLEEFFDAKTYRDRLNVLSALHSTLTDALVDTIAASLDTEIKNGDIEDRYYELKNYLLTMEKYECNRLR